jgi:hypothetical protein
MTRRREGLALLERVEAVLRNEALYAMAEAIPTTDPSRGGRPRKFPCFMVLAFEALISVYGSARQVAAELSHPEIWAFVRRIAAEETGQDLPAQPMARHNYLYARSRYLTDPEVLAALGELHRRLAADQAVELGLLDPDGPGSWTHPDPSRVVYGDGKVITPLFRAKPGEARVDRVTGEVVPRRSELDAELHFEGGGEAVWGTKFLLLAARGSDQHSRIILDVSFVPDKGGEAQVAQDCISRVAPLVPGAQTIVYDTALRGVHHQHILRDLGLIPVNRVAAAVAGSRNARRGEGRRVSKSAYVDTKKIKRGGKEIVVQLYARNGAIGLAEMHDGEMEFNELRRIRTHRIQDKSGSYRWYNDYELPDSHGGGTVTVRLHGDKTDKVRRLNRTENVRPIPPGDSDFQRLFRIRNDAESINRGIEDSLFIGRAHSIGHERQLVNLFGYALMVNGIAMLQRRRRLEQPPKLPLRPRSILRGLAEAEARLR